MSRRLCIAPLFVRPAETKFLYAGADIKVPEFHDHARE
jgi:hypothetical protein